MIDYAELHCISNFTFLDGASHPEELVRQADFLGYSAIALTDECSVAGVVRAHVAARQWSLSLIIGSKFSLADGPSIILLARNRVGYRNLVRLITRARRAASKGNYHLTSSELSASHIVGCLGILLSTPAPAITKTLKKRYAQLKWDTIWLQQLLPNQLWLSVEQPSNGFDQEHLSYLIDISKQTSVPLVATGNVHMHVRSRKKLQDTLTAIRFGTTIHKIKGNLHKNAEQHLRTLRLLEKTYPKNLLRESINISKRCIFSLDQLRYSYPNEFTPKGFTGTNYLHKLTIH